MTNEQDPRTDMRGKGSAKGVSVTESHRGRDVLAEEFFDVAWPWNVNSIPLPEHGSSLTGTDEEVRAAIDSLKALLRFLEKHGSKADSAGAAFPELDEVYWGLMGSFFDDIMPLLTDLTWSNFRRWVTERAPSVIGVSWDEPPGEFIEAVGWRWSSGAVDESLKAVSEWLIDHFRADNGASALPDLLESVTAAIPRLGDRAGAYVALLTRAGKEKALPYLERLAKNTQLPEKVQEQVRRHLSFIAERINTVGCCNSPDPTDEAGR